MKKWRFIPRVRVIVVLSTLAVVPLGMPPIIAKADPHTTIGVKNTPSSFAVREELEGTSGILNTIRIPHGCNGKPVKAMAVVFPDGANSQVTQTGTEYPEELSDHLVNPVPIVDPKPVQDRNIFKKVELVPGKAFHYMKGKLDTDLTGRVPWDASFPRFQEHSCATSMRVNIGIANYCTRSSSSPDRADIWIGFMTPLFDDPEVVVQSPPGFWPHLIVVRDLENNPIDGASCGDGYGITVTPSMEEIDAYLPIRGFWPSRTGKGDDDDD